MTIQIHVFFMYSLFIKNPFAKNRKIQQHRPDMYLHEAALSCDGPAASLTIITPLITLQKYQFKKPFCKGRTRDQGQGVQRIGRARVNKEWWPVASGADLLLIITLHHFAAAPSHPPRGHHTPQPQYTTFPVIYREAESLVHVRSVTL